MKNSNIKLDLSVFNILVNPKGSISSREYLVGMTSLFLIAFYQIIIGILTQITTVSFHQLNSDVITMASLNSTPNIFITPSSFDLLIFVSCLILSYKRSLDLNFKIITGIGFGIISYLGFRFVFLNSIQLATFYSINSADIIAKSSNYMILYSILSLIITSSAIALLIYFSTKKGNKENTIENKTLTNYILNLGKLILALIGFSFIMSLFYYLIQFDIKTVVIIGIIGITAFFVVYFYLNYKVSKGFRFMFYFNLIILIVYLCSLIAYAYLIKLTDYFTIYKVYYSAFTIINTIFFLSNLSFMSVKIDKKTPAFNEQ